MTDQTNKSLQRLEKKLLHYTNKAVSEYAMIQSGDRVMVCVSGGKDSYTMLIMLNKMRIRSNYKFEIQAVTLDQGQPGWDDGELREWMRMREIPFEIISEDTYSIVKEKIPEDKTYCGLCSRLRRGILYRHAEEHGFNKIALGHHRDDLITSLLMSILYNGQIKSMPPKLLSDNKRHIVIRPLAYCQEDDIIAYAKLLELPIIPCNLCGSQINLARVKTRQLIKELAAANPKVPSNILHALSSLQPSQLMDHRHWDFKHLESQQQIAEPEAHELQVDAD